MQKRWIIMFAFMLIISICGLFVPGDVNFGFNIELSEDAQLLANVAWLITATIFVLMMTPGLSFFYGGMVREKNVISTMLQSFIAMGIISVLWVVFGFSLCFGHDLGGVIGNPLSYLFFNNVGGACSDTNFVEGLSIPIALFALFQMKFAIITPSLITGSFAERVRFSGYLFFMIFFFIFVYCPLAHCTWHPQGLFASIHVKDFAGGIVVHASSGIAALAGAMFLGKRKEAGEHLPANVPFILLGAAMLWLGWFGFNAGSSLAADGMAIKAFLNTNTASAVAMITWIVFDCLRGRKPSAVGAAVGAVVGLVAITPSAGWVSVGESVFISFVTTLICNFAVYFKNKKSNLDDALDVFPTHGVGGIVGTLMTGIFVYNYEDPAVKAELTHLQYFGNHCMVMAGVIVYSFVVSYGLYWLTNKMIPMRVSEESEEMGLDMSQHDEVYGSKVVERELAEYFEHEHKGDD